MERNVVNKANCVPFCPTFTLCPNLTSTSVGNKPTRDEKKR